jgi:hypothetical protein
LFDSINGRESEPIVMEALWRDIPEFPQFKELSLAEKPLFDEAFTQFPPVISEFSKNIRSILPWSRRSFAQSLGLILTPFQEKGQEG